MCEWAGSDELSPSAAAVCSLSDILEPVESIPARFYLTAKACAGILRRAEKRGKELPPLLQRALAAVVASEPISTATEG
jgi:precorrin-3B methylase